ncbi:MAG: YrdB family protein [Chloroflexota bacterium]
MSTLKAANIGLRFGLEVCTVAALVNWGFGAGDGLLGDLLLGVGAPVLVVAAWGFFVSPKGLWRWPDPWRALLEVAIFGSGAAALLAADHPILAIGFAAAVALNMALLFAWRQRAY